VKKNLKLAGIITASLAAGPAMAWDCSYWSQSSNPKAECYKPPAAASVNRSVNHAIANSAASAQARADAHQDQSQTQVQSASATGGSASSEASNQGNSQSVNSYVERSAPSVGQGSFAIQGCSVAGNLGGSNIHGSAFLGIGFTPRECYKFQLAQAYQAIGNTYQACMILNSTDTMQKMAKQGVPLAECTKPVPVPAPEAGNWQPMERMYTQDQVRSIVRKAVSK